MDLYTLFTGLRSVSAPAAGSPYFVEPSAIVAVDFKQAQAA
ncbi:MAG: hypothetical protein WAR81_05995 [Pseudomonadales bacterium]|jgi:hypothetical protein